MRIERTEPTTGTPDRTRREEIVPLFTGPRGVEPEGYLDCSQSEGWEVAPPENSKPSRWEVQIEAVRQFIAPFEVLDSEAAKEQASGDDEMGGVYFYPFNNNFLPIGHGDDDGDLNSSNFDVKMNAFVRKYFDASGQPRGGTTIMAAIRAGDKHYLGEFGPGGENEMPREQRPIRARTVWTDGELTDVDAFVHYLEAATPSQGLGSRQEWDEAWAVAIIGHGEAAGAAYRQYLTIAQTYPFVHPYLFDQVSNPAEIAEDMAIAVAPSNA